MINPQFEWTGGGYATSARDLARWGHALYTAKAISTCDARPDDRAKPFPPGSDRKRTTVSASSSARRRRVGVVWGHSGFFPGYQTELIHAVDHGITLALQINTSAPRPQGTRSLLRAAYDLVATVR